MGEDETQSASVTIPLTITVTVGQPRLITEATAARRLAERMPAQDSAHVDRGTEAVASDYRGRKGYSPDFLGKQFPVELPTIVRGVADILSFDDGGANATVLKYEHFSVVMSKSRKMCFYSAVNINGKLSKKSGRVGWKWDPRIPHECQIMDQCYGDPPRFSRGHMTRREDPGWGDEATSKLGNQDSMHVTNATPQMQAFNSPIWLALEDYALGHAREDEMKISVFTGPYFGKRDPPMYGVRIPLAFWKVIAFIHDDTGELCATGYEMSQEQSLQPEEEFVFGAFKSPQLGTATQVSIRSIEKRSGLSFNGLADADPFESEQESIAPKRPSSPLGILEKIQFF